MAVARAMRRAERRRERRKVIAHCRHRDFVSLPREPAVRITTQGGAGQRGGAGRHERLKRGGEVGAR